MKIKIEQKWREKTIKTVKRLSNGWYVIKTEILNYQKILKLKRYFHLNLKNQ